MAKVGRMVKTSLVSVCAAHLTERPNVFLAEMTRLPAPEADAFRKKLHSAQSRLFLIKRRLGLRVIEPLKLSGLPELLNGSVGFIFSGEDVLHTAKVLVEFRKSHEEQLQLRGAIIEGQLLDAVHVEQLAALPSKPVLLAWVVATIESPVTDVIVTVEQLIGDLAWLVEQAAGRTPADPSTLATDAPDVPSGSGSAPTAQATEAMPSHPDTMPKPEEGTQS